MKMEKKNSSIFNIFTQTQKINDVDENIITLKYRIKKSLQGESFKNQVQRGGIYLKKI